MTLEAKRLDRPNEGCQPSPGTETAIREARWNWTEKGGNWEKASLLLKNCLIVPKNLWTTQIVVVIILLLYWFHFCCLHSLYAFFLPQWIFSSYRLESQTKLLQLLAVVTLMSKAQNFFLVSGLSLAGFKCLLGMGNVEILFYAFLLYWKARSRLGKFLFYVRWVTWLCSKKKLEYLFCSLPSSLSLCPPSLSLLHSSSLLLSLFNKLHVVNEKKKNIGFI